VPPPPYDQVRQRLEQIVRAKEFRLYLNGLMQYTKIERSLPESANARAPATPPAPTAASGASAPSKSPATPPAAPAAPGTTSAPTATTAPTKK
jgi:hypothetical protein